LALFVFLTDSCQSDAQTYGLRHEVDKLIQRVETSQSLSVFDPFPPPYLVKKKLGGRQGRLIARQQWLGDHTVVVLLAVMIRGKREYEAEFAADPVGYGRQHFDALVAPGDLERFVAERLARAPAPQKADPSPGEFAFLYSAFAHHSPPAIDRLVCESAYWVAQVGQPRVANQLALLNTPCRDILVAPEGLHATPVPGKSGWAIWAFNNTHQTLLLALATDSNGIEAERFARDTVRALHESGGDSLLRSSRRAYPALLLADDDLWIELEKESEANMALSPEESAVLASARQPDHPFPLFINGRAGSGKSTILQYLFTDLLFCYLRGAEQQGVAPPLYLTANGELLRRARSFVERLLRSEATFAPDGGGDLVDSNLDVIGEAFQQFQPYLLSLVSAEARASRFLRTHYVDYSRFRALWLDRFGKDQQAVRDFGPDVSWHVIRTYIKGLSADGDLDANDYSQLPQNQLSVTTDTFAAVFDRVWKGWYSDLLADRALWDDQDLARYILDEGLAHPKHPAIFCDEAQDFTRQELTLLLRLNLFSDRALPPHDIGRVPFAFAGDQFQTLNPTGFRWDAIKASFVEKFIHELDPARRSGRTDLNYRELQYNYRSTPRIVRFSNHIQALRAALFTDPDVRPQEPWTQTQDDFPVVWFYANNAEFWKAFREHTGLIVIVPCNEGEEAAFVANDPYLQQHVVVEDDVPVNVVSASRAKGCEYPAVIVYGFGAASARPPLHFSVADELHSDHVRGGNRALALQYFVNRLYVAVSRPKRRLVIVDTPEGFNALWQSALDQSLEADLLRRIRNGAEVWADRIEGATAGIASELTKDTAGDPLENAKTFEDEGLARRDHFMMMQAAQAYRSAGQQLKAQECRARAFEFNGSFLEAGEHFVDAGFSKDGVRCLWRAGAAGWASLRSRVGTFPDIRGAIEYRWSAALEGRLAPDEVVALLEALVRHFVSDSAFAERCAGDDVWRGALEALLQKALPDANVWADGRARRIAQSLHALEARGLRGPDDLVASVYFKADRFADAVSRWEAAGSTRSREYLRAKATAEPYPERLSALSKLELVDEMIADYEAHPGVALAREQAAVLVEALGKAGRVDEAADLAWNTGNADDLLHMARAAKDHNRPDADVLLSGGLQLLVREGRWEPVVNFLSSGKFTPSRDWTNDGVRRWVEAEQPRLHRALVQALARSERLPDAPTHVQRQLTEFLKGFVASPKERLGGTISVAEVGAALERAGRFVEGIAFYERVAGEAGSEADQKLAWARWAVCKERQVQHERAQGARKKADKSERELRRVQDEWGIESVATLDRYPKLPPLSFREQRPSPAKANPSTPTINAGAAAFEDVAAATIGPFKIEVSRKVGRINITNTESLEMAFFRTGDQACLGEGHFSRSESGDWTSDEWGMTLMSDAVSTDSRVTIAIRRLGLAITVRMA
jgi:tetratricopeptide (TPR) repeat protein